MIARYCAPAGRTSTATNRIEADAMAVRENDMDEPQLLWSRRRGRRMANAWLSPVVAPQESASSRRASEEAVPGHRWRSARQRPILRSMALTGKVAIVTGA